MALETKASFQCVRVCVRARMHAYMSAYTYTDMHLHNAKSFTGL